MTIAIASYQRRASVLRLLHGLDEQLASDEELAADLDIVVVLDGSTDGSKEAIDAQHWSVPVRVHAQENQGLASARNVGLRAAEDHLVWFLDDDLIPSADLVRTHRCAHAHGPEAVVVGPCRIPPDADAPAGVVAWWDDFYADLENEGGITRFDRFTTANTSAPARLLNAVGGFDASFVEYGLEDYELAVRLLARHVTIRFAAEAIAWHPDVPSVDVLVAREYSVGLNAVRLARLHPETLDVLFPVDNIPLPRRMLRQSRLRSPRALMAVSRVAFGVSRATSRRGGTLHGRTDRLARAAAHAAGVAKGDPTGELLGRVLGDTRGT